MTRPSPPLSTCVLVPVKGFERAKERLAPVLPPAERAALARTLAERVVRAAAGVPVAVVCDEPDVARFARETGASVLWRPGRGLDAAVSEGVRALRHYSEVVVAHGDLWQPEALLSLTGFDGITLVPDRHGDGTNVIVLPPRCGFRFAYGPRSYRRHLAEAERVGCPVRVVSGTALSYDVDTPDDLLAVGETRSEVAPCG